MTQDILTEDLVFEIKDDMLEIEVIGIPIIVGELEEEPKAHLV